MSRVQSEEDIPHGRLMCFGSAEAYEDSAGLLLPPLTEEFLDTWKRPGELVQNLPDVPMLRLKPGSGAVPTDAKGTPDCVVHNYIVIETGHAVTRGLHAALSIHVAHVGAKGAPAAALSRSHEGRLFPGHKSFEWLKSVFDAVISAQKKLPPGDFLWELINPKDPKDGTPLKNTSGKYRVRLNIMVNVNDGFPVSFTLSVVPLLLHPGLLFEYRIRIGDAPTCAGGVAIYYVHRFLD